MEKIIELSHGAGGLKMDSLIHAIQECYTYRQTSDNDVGMDALDDGAIVSVGSEDIVITMDGHTIDPLRFPGGDIGKLAACGTINDLVMMGAQPLALTVALVIEEGFPFDDLREYLVSLDQVCRNDGVAIIGGDTKIVPKGKIDKLMIVTTGIGKRISKERILDSNVQVGDSIIISGPIGMHGIALLSFREGLSFSTSLTSDVNSLAAMLLPIAENQTIHAMKDPTRGGLASAINEWAEKSRKVIYLQEESIPMKPAVRSAADMLGLDPLDITCEGCALIAVSKTDEGITLEKLRKHPLGTEAAAIGTVTAEGKGRVLMETRVGGLRRLQKPVGELIPRVC